MTLGERIATARKQAGLSQEQLGEKLGVSRQAVSKWESNQSNPDIAYLAQICRLFRISSDWLLLGEENNDYIPARCPSCQGIVTGLEQFCPNCGLDLSQGHLLHQRYTIIFSEIRAQNQSQFYERLAQFYEEQRDQKNCILPDSVLNTLQKGPLSPKDLKPLFFLPPSILCKQADYQTARHICELMDGHATVQAYPADDQSALSELVENHPVAALSTAPSTKPEGLSFGMAVLAVIVGVIAAVLLLSFL